MVKCVNVLHEVMNIHYTNLDVSIVHYRNNVFTYIYCKDTRKRLSIGCGPIIFYRYRAINWFNQNLRYNHIKLWLENHC